VTGDYVVERRIDEVQSWNSSPVPQYAGLEMLRLEWFGEEKILLEIQLGCTNIVGIASKELKPLFG